MLSNPKAQSALEYLMTYGWALVIIVTVASVLFMVFAPSASTFTCTSSDPTKIILESYNLQFSSIIVNALCQNNETCLIWGYDGMDDPQGKIVLLNATGGKISITGLKSQQNNDYLIEQISKPPLYLYKIFFSDFN